MQTAPAREMSHQYLVSRAQDTANGIQRFLRDAEPAIIAGLVDESLRESARDLMESVFEPFTHQFMSALDVDIDNLRVFMLAVYDCQYSIPEIFAESCERQRKARYARVVLRKPVTGLAAF